MNRHRSSSRRKEIAPTEETDGSASGGLDPGAGQQESASGAGARPGGWPAVGSVPAGPAAAGTGAATLPGMGAVVWPGGWGQPAGAGALAGLPGSSAAAAAWAAARASGLGASMMAGGADAATGGGWPDWWSNIAITALGQDWLRADPNVFTGISTSGTNQATDEARLYSTSAGNPSATTASVDGRVLARSTSARRRGGRAQRPPVPPSIATAPASVDVDLTDTRFPSDDDDMDNSGSDDDAQTMILLESAQNNLWATALVASKYFMTYLDKNEVRTPAQSGFSWTLEKLNTSGESHKQFRMDASLFYKLHDLLVSTYGLQSSLHMNSIDSLAIFLLVCGQGMSYSALDGIFKHSNETISRKFDDVLNCVVAMCENYIRPIDPNFSTTHSRISSDRRMMPHFKDCIGALDGTHISATPPPHDIIRYIGRSGKASQNVLAVVDFDMRFTYASIGQPGSMRDTNVLFHALKHDHHTFPHTPPIGKYYHVDAGYPNRPGYLAPYKGERYHVPDWRRGPPPSGEQELFNHLHSSIHNVVERAFGVWKMKWRILLKMPSYPMEKQKMIVAATICLHNFICENHAQDRDFHKCDRNPEYVPTIPSRYSKYLSFQSAGDTSTSQSNDRNMDKFCDDLARAIFLSRSS